MDTIDDIECDGLVRVFIERGIEVQALQGLELRVRRGEMVALVGASGSGKSTLLRILAGLDVPTAGRAVVAGDDLGAMSARARLEYRRRSVGFVAQQAAANLLPFLSVADNIGAVHLLARVVPPRERAERAASLLELLELGAVAARRPDQLSGGQRQRAAVAVALANRPRVVLADEPTGELDEDSAAEVLTALERVNREEGTTALLVTHDPAVAEHVDRTIGIRDGRTSVEVQRRTEVDELGQRVRVATEYAVLDRAGRLQLPAEHIEALALRDRVRLDLREDRVELRPDGADTDGAGSRA
ncbi:MAG: ABC transporter ATP-binding protein [Actinomycetales bacterium]|nr:ABC transporter ATP-binding protein [Actinomycetales bacterium]